MTRRIGLPLLPHQWRKPAEIVVGWDPAGTGADDSVITVLERIGDDPVVRQDADAPRSVMLGWPWQVSDAVDLPADLDLAEQAALVARLIRKRWSESVVDVAAESNGVGLGAVQALTQGLRIGADVRRLALVNTVAGATQKPTAKLTPGQPEDWSVGKLAIIGSLELILEHRRIGIPEDAHRLRDQLAVFERRVTPSGAVTASAAGSGHDDYVMSLALAVWLADSQVRHPVASRGRISTAARRQIGTRPPTTQSHSG